MKRWRREWLRSRYTKFESHLIEFWVPSDKKWISSMAHLFLYRSSNTAEPKILPCNFWRICFCFHFHFSYGTNSFNISCKYGNATHFFLCQKRALRCINAIYAHSTDYAMPLRLLCLILCAQNSHWFSFRYKTFDFHLLRFWVSFNCCCRVFASAVFSSSFCSVCPINRKEFGEWVAVAVVVVFGRSFIEL